jgi:hypothetical protein
MRGMVTENSRAAMLAAVTHCAKVLVPQLVKIDHSLTSLLGHYLCHEKETQPKTDTCCPLSDLWCRSGRKV